MAGRLLSFAILNRLQAKVAGRTAPKLTILQNPVSRVGEPESQHEPPPASRIRHVRILGRWIRGGRALTAAVGERVSECGHRLVLSGGVSHDDSSAQVTH